MSKHYFLFFAIVGFILMICMNTSCHKDLISTSGDSPLRFSVDTLRFDTVFTTLGSATRSIKIYNDQEEAIIIDDIRMLKHQSSFFRLNVDGITDIDNNTFRIEGMDSIYVFAEVTIDPDQPLNVSPFFIEDQVIVSSNQKEYTFWLEAWGQNANYLPSKTSKSQVNYISCDLSTWEWNDPKPYVIYGALLIDSCEVVIPAGTQIYVHGGVAINELGIYNDGLLFILSEASLKIMGTADQPVGIQTDRLEHEFDALPGQWSGILIGPGSTGNEFNHAQIKNSIVGVSVDSTAALQMESCILSYTSGDGLRATHASVFAENCLFYQNGTYGVNLNFGGSYYFNHCTVVNRDNQLSALNANNLKCTDPLCSGEILVNPLSTQFYNCIFVGNDTDEINLLDATGGTDPALFDYAFSNTILSVDDLLDPDNFPNFFDNCDNCINVNSLDSLFIDLDNYNYHLDTMSIAIDKALPFAPITDDLEGNPRDSKPDIGCYEFQK